MTRVAGLLGIGTPETVRKWCRQAEVDVGARPGVSSEDTAELKRLKRENAELKRANAILKAASLVSTGQRNRATILSAGVS
jgi:transposase